MNSLPETEKLYARAIRAPRSKACINVRILGHRDPRGPDNNVRVWVDEKDQLHIRIEKTNRCYKYHKTINTEGYVEVIAT